MGQYPPDYVTNVFLVWYQKGKIGARDLQNAIPPDTFGDKPTVTALWGWIKGDFADRAKELDDQVNRQIAERAVAIKIEMLERHARIGSEMQDMALKYLDDNKDNLGVGSSVRLLIEGVRIERESRGLPEALQELSHQSDEDLMKEIEKLMSSAQVSFLPGGEEQDE